MPELIAKLCIMPLQCDNKTEKQAILFEHLPVEVPRWFWERTRLRVAASCEGWSRVSVSAQRKADAISDRFSLLGSMVLWIFWPNFCSAVVPPEHMPRTVIATLLALCGATLVTFIASCLSRQERVSSSDLANAALAGGVAIGATCNQASPLAALSSARPPGHRRLPHQTTGSKIEAYEN